MVNDQATRNIHERKREYDIKKAKDFKIHPDNSAYNCIFLVEILFNRKKPWSDFAKALLKIFAVLLFIHIPRMILHFVFENDILDNVLYYVSLYPTFFGIAAVVVADQCQHEEN